MNIERFTDRYFLNAQSACKHAGENRRVLYQVFQRDHSVLCGMKYVRPLLDDLSDVTIDALDDGAEIEPLDTVMHIAGPIVTLLPYETIYLGLLARMTRIATNVRAAVREANGKPVLFFPARFDVPEVQEYDGYASMIGGAAGASTAAGAAPFGKRAVGTMPHAMIAVFDGDTVRATLALADACPNEPIWSLVDFENDCARTSVEVYRAFRERGLTLAGVRLDTSQSLVDEGLRREGIEERGVTPALVRLVRKALDEAGGREVKIAVSGGFTAEKVRNFEAVKTPVDVYAIGESFFRRSVPFTSDIVGYWRGENFEPCAKQGRSLNPNPKLKRWS
jgi:nicotinate phosphoribosyltransferase